MAKSVQSCKCLGKESQLADEDMGCIPMTCSFLKQVVATGGVWFIHNRKLIHGMQSLLSMCSSVFLFSRLQIIQKSWST